MWHCPYGMEDAPDVHRNHSGCGVVRGGRAGGISDCKTESRGELLAIRDARLLDSVPRRPVMNQYLLSHRRSGTPRRSTLSEDQTLEDLDPDHVIVSATVRDIGRLEWWLSRFGPLAEV